VSSNFYDEAGSMVGIDAHKYLMLGPGPAAVTGIPVENTAHLAFSPHAVDTCLFWKKCDTVTSDGMRMIQKGFKLYLVTHIPLTALPPAALELGQIALIILTSKSSPMLGVAGVTGEGGSLAVCASDAVGANSNCGTPGLGVVINANTVKTTPTLGDFFAAAMGALDGAFYGGIFSGLIPPIVGDIEKFLLKELLIGPVLVPLAIKTRNFIRDKIPSFVRSTVHDITD
jgi:hypothetical protein